MDTGLLSSGFVIHSPKARSSCCLRYKLFVNLVSGEFINVGWRRPVVPCMFGSEERGLGDTGPGPGVRASFVGVATGVFPLKILRTELETDNAESCEVLRFQDAIPKR